MQRVAGAATQTRGGVRAAAGEAVVGMHACWPAGCGRRGARRCQPQPLDAHSSSDPGAHAAGRPGPNATQQTEEGGGTG